MKVETNTEAPAVTIERAASLMRERAEAASRGPWKYPYRGFSGVVGSRHGCLWTSGGRVGQINHEPDAEHIAAMDPSVGLAVADWLEWAVNAGFLGDSGGGALAVALAYLGESR